MLPPGPYFITRRLSLLRACERYHLTPDQLDQLEHDDPMLVADMLEADAIERAERAAELRRIEKVILAASGLNTNA